MRRSSILIVDDEPNIRLMLRTTLESALYSVCEAADGEEALRQIAISNPDAMILDLSMPRMDGLGVLTELNKLCKEARRPRVLVLTAYGSIAAAVKATRLGAIDFLEKPVVPDEVREAVAAILASPLAGVGEFASDDPLEGGYQGVLARVRRLMRTAEYTDAETLLMKAADLAVRDAAYFNLLGVLYEVRRQHRLARKFYGKAIAADKDYAPAQLNMRRIYELYTFGSSSVAAALGDEQDSSSPRVAETSR